ncbi:MAG TPA: oligosaccharide flippase family protein, partial [Aggregicoccus sp.]|nr:oligosaccharide flippase family protein [Aggregicoccus sp.]
RVGCFQLPVVDLLYTPTSEVLMVRLGELERDGRAHEGVGAFREASAKLAFAFLPFTAFLLAVAPELLAAFFGPKFLPAVPLFRVAVLGVVLAVLPMDGVLRARGQTRWLFVSYLVKAAVTVPLVVAGVKLFGMMGGVLSWLLAEGVGKATLLARVPRALQGPGQQLAVRDVLPWRALAQASGAALLAGLCVLGARALAPQALHAALPPGLLGRALPLALAGVLVTASYVGLLYAAGIRVPWPRRAAASP